MSKTITITSIVASLCIGLGIGYNISFLNQDNEYQNLKVITPHIPTSLVGSNVITCQFPRSISANFMDSKITHEINKIENQPIIETYRNFELDNIITFSYIDSLGSIQELDAIVLLNNDDVLVLATLMPVTNVLETRYIYKRDGVASYTKNWDIFGTTPFSRLSMGTCNIGI